MSRLDPELRRTWLFGPGADLAAHDRMFNSGANALILDLEDFTPPERRDEARAILPGFVARCRELGCMVAVRINQLEKQGTHDLDAVMKTQPDAVVYPMAEHPQQIHELNTAIAQWEATLNVSQGSTEIVPVCETALGVVNVRSMAAASPRISCAILGSEDLAADLCAERGPDAVELAYARRRFLLECRASKIEPVDAPYTYNDLDGAKREAEFSRRLGYRSKSLVRPDHAEALNGVFTPGLDELKHAREIVAGFEAARERGEERVLVNGLWVEIPAYRNACRIIDRANRLGISN